MWCKQSSYTGFCLHNIDSLSIITWTSLWPNLAETFLLSNFPFGLHSNFITVLHNISITVFHSIILLPLLLVTSLYPSLPVTCPNLPHVSGSNSSMWNPLQHFHLVLNLSIWSYLLPSPWLSRCNLPSLPPYFTLCHYLNSKWQHSEQYWQHTFSLARETFHSFHQIIS